MSLMSNSSSDKPQPPRELNAWSGWERRQRAVEDRMPELGLLGRLLVVVYSITSYPIRAIVNTRKKMKRTRQVRDMLYGPKDDGTEG
jgi:hypothetical protein